MTEYIQFRNNKYLVRNDIESFLLFYEIFLFRPRMRTRFMLNIIDLLVIPIIKVVFRLKVNYLFKKMQLKDNFLISRNGNGSFPNRIFLIENNSKYNIVKRFHSNKIFNNELSFLRQYKNNPSGINVLRYAINKDGNSITYEFLKMKNFSTLIMEGKYSKKKLIKLYEKISSELDKFYRYETKALIHGDLVPCNIYINDNKIYIIDYSDTEYYDTKYDKYTLLIMMLTDMSVNKQQGTICKYFTGEEINKYKVHFLKKKRQKHTSEKEYTWHEKLLEN